MPDLKFEKCGADPRTGEMLYRLIIGGRTVREDLTLDQVVEAINRQDEERLGWDHAPRGDGEDGSLRSLRSVGMTRGDGGADPGEPLSPAEPDSSP